MHGRDLWQNSFVNIRSTVITELSKVYGYDQHSIGLWLGNTPLIQNRHYLQIMDDDHREAMRNWRDSKKGSSKGSRTNGSHLSVMIFRALRKVCPVLRSSPKASGAGWHPLTTHGKMNLSRHQDFHCRADLLARRC